MAQKTPVGGPILSGASFLYLEECYRPVVVRVRLREAVDPERLQRAVDRALRIHSWAACGIRRMAGAFFYHDGLPKTIRVAEADWEDLPPLGGARAEGHLLGVCYLGSLLSVSFFHGLTDGKGVFSFIEEMLRGYQSPCPEAAGAPGGPCAEVFRDAGPAGGAAPEDVSAEPFEAARALFDRLHPEAADSGEAAPAENPSFFVPGCPASGPGQPRHGMIRAGAEDLLRLAKGCGVRPAALFVTLFARALLRAAGAPAPFRVMVPADFRKALEIPHTFRNCAVPPLMFDLAPETLRGDFRALAAAAQRRISAMTEKAAVIRAVRRMAEDIGPLLSLPYAEGAALFARLAGGPRYTFNLSCNYRASREPFVSMIDSVYVVYPAPPGSLAVQVSALPDCFCICVNQGDAAPAREETCSVRGRASGAAPQSSPGQPHRREPTFIEEALRRELTDHGIPCAWEDSLAGNVGRVELREYEHFEWEGGGPA